MNMRSILILFLTIILFPFSSIAGEKNEMELQFERVKKKAEIGFLDMQKELACFYYYAQGVEKNYKEAFKWYQKSANQGNTKAQHSLGVLYYNGQGVEKNYKEAFKWYQKSANQGNATAQFYLGISYNYGYGVEKNYKEAFKWYQKSANQGNASAQFNLGILYYKGQGVEKNYKKTFYWSLKSAKQGFHKAQAGIGELYNTGKGVPKNYVQAYKWFSIALSNKEEKIYRDELNYLEQRMTAIQIEKAQSLASKWNDKDIAEENEVNGTKENKLKIRSSGSGVIISSNGYILTAEHVIDNSKKITVLIKQKNHVAKIISKDSANDIAILKVTTNNLPYVDISPSYKVKLGDNVFTIGFPNTSIQGTSPKITFGSINSLKGLLDDPRHWQISTAIQQGSSGSGLFNKNGKLIGIVVMKLDDKIMAKYTGELPQNVNYALKNGYFLDSIQPIIEENYNQKMQKMYPYEERNELIKRISKSAVLIKVY